MIKYPSNWQSIGQAIDVNQIEDTLQLILSEIDCDCLSFSGGIDSSLLLYYMLEQGREVKTFTIACSESHPDIKYAKIVLAAFERKFGKRIESNWQIIKTGVLGDALVKSYYQGLSQWTDNIIAGDGIDEFMAGYYKHQELSNEAIYYDYLRRLQIDQLIPLNENSGKVQVYLPYLDKRLIYLMSQIPLWEKVDTCNRKKLMVKLAQGKLPQKVIDRRKYGFCTKNN